MQSYTTEPKQKITLTQEQNDVLQDILSFLMDPDEMAMVVRGPAGTGKTTLVKKLLDEIPKHREFIKMLTPETNAVPWSEAIPHYPIETYLTSTTHKAGDVLGAATGRRTNTIHGLMKLRMERDHDTGEEYMVDTDKTPAFKQCLIIIDEAGMVDENLYGLIKKHTSKCKVLMIGDPYQLPPVNEKASLAFTEIPHQAKLTTIMRQAAGNPIIQFSAQYRYAQDGNKFPAIRSIEPQIMHLEGEDFREEIHQAFHQTIHPDAARVLCWTNNRVTEYNQYIREFKGYPADFMPDEWVITNRALIWQKAVQKRADGVVQIRTIESADMDGIQGWNVTFHSTNGEYFFTYDYRGLSKLKKKITRAARTEKNPDKRRELWKLFYAFEDKCCDLRPAYSNTINKAQGSTYQTVFMDLTDIGRSWDREHVAKLMYTATTRAAEKLYLYGDLPRRYHEHL